MTFEWHGSGHGLLGVWFGYQSTWRSHLGVVLQSFDLRAFLEDCTCTTWHFVNASSLVKYLHGRNAEINGPHHNFCSVVFLILFMQIKNHWLLYKLFRTHLVFPSDFLIRLPFTFNLFFCRDWSGDTSNPLYRKEKFKGMA